MTNFNLNLKASAKAINKMVALGYPNVTTEYPVVVGDNGSQIVAMMADEAIFTTDIYDDFEADLTKGKFTARINKAIKIKMGLVQEKPKTKAPKKPKAKAQAKVEVEQSEEPEQFERTKKYRFDQPIPYSEMMRCYVISETVHINNLVSLLLEADKSEYTDIRSLYLISEGNDDLNTSVAHSMVQDALVSTFDPLCFDDVVDVVDFIMTEAVKHPMFARYNTTIENADNSFDKWDIANSPAKAKILAYAISISHEKLLTCIEKENFKVEAIKPIYNTCRSIAGDFFDLSYEENKERLKKISKKDRSILTNKTFNDFCNDFINVYDVSALEYFFNSPVAYALICSDIVVPEEEECLDILNVIEYIANRYFDLNVPKNVIPEYLASLTEEEIASCTPYNRVMTYLKTLGMTPFEPSEYMFHDDLWNQYLWRKVLTDYAEDVMSVFNVSEKYVETYINHMWFFIEQTKFNGLTSRYAFEIMSSDEPDVLIRELKRANHPDKNKGQHTDDFPAIMEAINLVTRYSKPVYEEFEPKAYLADNRPEPDFDELTEEEKIIFNDILDADIDADISTLSESEADEPVEEQVVQEQPEAHQEPVQPEAKEEPVEQSKEPEVKTETQLDNVVTADSFSDAKITKTFRPYVLENKTYEEVNKSFDDLAAKRGLVFEEDIATKMFNRYFDLHIQPEHITLYLGSAIAKEEAKTLSVCQALMQIVDNQGVCSKIDIHSFVNTPVEEGHLRAWEYLITRYSDKICSAYGIDLDTLRDVKPQETVVDYDAIFADLGLEEEPKIVYTSTNIELDAELDMLVEGIEDHQFTAVEVTSPSWDKNHDPEHATKVQPEVKPEPKPEPKVQPEVKPVHTVTDEEFVTYFVDSTESSDLQPEPKVSEEKKQERRYQPPKKTKNVAPKKPVKNKRGEKYQEQDSGSAFSLADMF